MSWETLEDILWAHIFQIEIVVRLTVFTCSCRKWKCKVCGQDFCQEQGSRALRCLLLLKEKFENWMKLPGDVVGQTPKDQMKYHSCPFPGNHPTCPWISGAPAQVESWRLRRLYPWRAALQPPGTNRPSAIQRQVGRGPSPAWRVHSWQWPWGLVQVSGGTRRQSRRWSGGRLFSPTAPSRPPGKLVASSS